MATNPILQREHFSALAPTASPSLSRPLVDFRAIRVFQLGTRERLPMSDITAPSPDEEAILLEKAQQGDRSAMEQLLVTHQDRIFRTALGFLGGDQEGALEVAQDVLISVSRNLAQFRGESRFSTWLYRMTINYSKNYKTAKGRRAARFVSLDQQDHSEEDSAPSAKDFPADSPSPRAQAAGAEMIAILHARLAELPEEYGTVLSLRFIEDRSYDEISEILSIPVGTVKSRINRGRSELRALMGDILSKGGSAA